jgi:3-oxoacyl-[acyl-carrier protein] reductase
MYDTVFVDNAIQGGRMNLGIQNKVALVTAASRGLGFAVAERLSQEGVIVAICGRSKDRIEEAANNLRNKTGGAIEPFEADVTDHPAVH